MLSRREFFTGSWIGSIASSKERMSPERALANRLSQLIRRSAGVRLEVVAADAVEIFYEYAREKEQAGPL
jgi:hypothetical protein